MFHVVGYALIAVGVGRITYELGTGKYLTASWQVDATRAQKPRSYWLGITLDFLMLIFLACLVMTNGFQGFGRH
jgi:hypothetical protein